MGGRYALSFWLVLGSAPPMVFGFVATEITTQGAGRWWAYLLVGLIGHAVLFVVLAAARLFPAFSSEKFTPWGLVLGVYLVAGELRMLALVAGLDAFDLPNTVPLWSRAITSGLLVPLAYGFSSYGLEALRAYRNRRGELIRSVVTATSELDRQRAATEALRSALVSEVGQEIEGVNRELRSELARLRKRIDRGDDIRPELAELLEQSDRRWRRISHDTWERAQVTVPQPSGWEVLDVLARSRPLSLFTLVVSSFFLFSLALGRALELVPAIFWTAVWIVFATSLAWAVNELGSRVTRGEIAASFTGLLILVASGAWFYAVPGLSPTDASGAFAIHITNVAAALTIGFAPSLLRNQQLVLVALQRRLDSATLERIRNESELVVVAQQVASRLHSNARGELLARVLQLQKALDQGDWAGAHGAIQQIDAALDVVDIHHSRPSDEELLKFLDNWAGFVEIRHNLKGISAPADVHSVVNEIVMEAVNNAIRHGNATWVDIALSQSADGWALVVSNDGDPVPALLRPGMGTKVLEKITPGAWSLETTSEGPTVLEVRFPDS